MTWTITHTGNRYHARKGTRNCWLTEKGGVLRQTTKDGAPVSKRLPPKELAAIVAAIETGETR